VLLLTSGGLGLGLKNLVLFTSQRVFKVSAILIHDIAPCRRRLH